MSPEVIASIVAAIAALITAIITPYLAHKNQAKVQEVINKSQKELQEISNKHQRELQEILLAHQEKIGILSHTLTTQYSKKFEVLTKIYQDFAEIKFELESYVAPYFSNSETKSQENIERAKKLFMELYKYILQNKIFISELKIESKLGEIMSNINGFENRQQNKDGQSWSEQVQIVQNNINPIIYNIGQLIQKELDISSKKLN